MPRKVPDQGQRHTMPAMDSNHLHLARSLETHALRWPQEAAKAQRFVDLLAEAGTGKGDPFTRSREQGHFTGSAWLVSADGRNVLLTHHRKLDRWLQLGGHADGDVRLDRVALREAGEESGLAGLLAEPDIFDLDIHWIPQRHEVAGHWHYDARYVIRATHSEAFAVSEESHALEWRDIRALAADDEVDASLRRMAERWLRLCRQTHR